MRDKIQDKGPITVNIEWTNIALACKKSVQLSLSHVPNKENACTER